MEIEIPGWEKFNPRSDRTNFTWLRFENKFFENPDIYDLSDKQKLLYIFILCQASKAGGGKFKLSVNFTADVVGISRQKLDTELRLLGDLVSVCRHNGDTMTRTIRDETIRDDTKKPSVSSSAVAEELKGLEYILSEKVTLKVQQGWLKVYPADYLCQELKQSQLWLDANPLKNPKSSWSRFFTGWLKRGWENYRKSIESNPGGSQGGNTVDIKQYFKE